LSYQESLQRFVKDAGPLAKLIAERKYLEYSRRVQAQSLWRPSPFGSQSQIGSQPLHFGSSNSLVSNNYGPSSASVSTTNCSAVDDHHVSDKFEYQACKLQTDELLTLFSLIGTPEFLQRSLASSSKQDLDSKRGFSPFPQGGMGATQSGVDSMKQIDQHSNFKPEVPNSRAINEVSIWQPRLTGSKPWKERELTGPEEKEASPSAGAGYYQTNNYSFPPKPTYFNMFHGKK